MWVLGKSHGIPALGTRKKNNDYVAVFGIEKVKVTWLRKLRWLCASFYHRTNHYTGV